MSKLEAQTVIEMVGMPVVVRGKLIDSVLSRSDQQCRALQHYLSHLKHSLWLTFINAVIPLLQKQL